VASADETAKKAKSLGGNVISEPFDVIDVGRMANIQDPQGAKFAIWQARRHKGADVINEPNTMCWNELSTNDIEAARKFYSALFAWKLKVSPGYTEAHLADDTAVGGMARHDERVAAVLDAVLRRERLRQRREEGEITRRDDLQGAAGHREGRPLRDPGGSSAGDLRGDPTPIGDYDFLRV
jgi:predicted enzyme related to lactoylglutathione lyase